MTDANNGGYIHAPSIPHADAAAVLRAGFLAAEAGGTTPAELSVNLSSDRVRVALTLIEGIRDGQSLGALLGYQFELRPARRLRPRRSRSVHLSPAQAFPLVADSLASTQTGPTSQSKSIEARNVLDGKKLVDQIAQERDHRLPVGRRRPAGRRAPRADRTRRRGRHFAAIPTTPSRTWRSPKACTKPCRETTIESRARSPRTLLAIFRRSPRSSTRRLPASVSRIGLLSSFVRGSPRLPALRRARRRNRPSMTG